MRFGTARKDLYGGLSSAMQEQFCSPSEVVLLARVRFDCGFVFFDRPDRVAAFLLCVASQAMRVACANCAPFARSRFEGSCFLGQNIASADVGIGAVQAHIAAV